MTAPKLGRVGRIGLIVLLIAAGALLGSTFTRMTAIKPVAGAQAMQVADKGNSRIADFEKATVTETTNADGKFVAEAPGVSVTVANVKKAYDIDSGPVVGATLITTYKPPIKDDVGLVDRRIMYVLFPCQPLPVMMVVHIVIVSPDDKNLGQELNQSMMMPFEAGSALEAAKRHVCKQGVGV